MARQIVVNRVIVWISGWSEYRDVSLAAETRAAIVRIAAALSFGSELLIYPTLWRDRPHGPPTVPLWSWLPELPWPGELVLWAAMIAACVVLVTGKWARAAAIVLAAAYAITCIVDQTRFQPHLTVYPVILLVVTPRRLTPRQALQGVRLALASLYFFAGLAKLNIIYVTIVHPGMMAPLVGITPGFLRPLLAFPWIVPIVEMSIGAATFYAGPWRHRRVILAAALGMHAFIITMLLVASHDLTVIPFNLGLAVCAFSVLFDKDEADYSIRLRSAPRLALAYALIIPVFGLLGLADFYLAHSYYAGSESRMRWYASEAAIERLLKTDWIPEERRALLAQPPEFPPGVHPAPSGMREVPLHDSYYLATGQGQIGEARIADRIKERLCDELARSPDDVMVRFFGRANPITGDRSYRDVNCAGSLGFWMYFGGFTTVVIGGSGDVHELVQRGPAFF